MTKEPETRWIKGQDEKWHEIDSSDRDYDQALSEKPVEGEEGIPYSALEDSTISVAGPPADSTIPANGLYDEDEEAPIGEAIENILNEADFKEEDHPRDGGKFTTKGGGAGKKADKPKEKRFTMKQYERNEDINYHDENARSLVKQYGTPEELEEIDAIAKKKSRGI